MQIANDVMWKYYRYIQVIILIKKNSDILDTPDLGEEIGICLLVSKIVDKGIIQSVDKFCFKS